MYIPKFRHKVLLLMCVVIVALGLVVMANAYIRPANPTMDYVWQNYGIYDTYYCNFKEPDCRACHGTSTAIRHHGTAKAMNGQCLFCHSIIPGVVPPERDCKVCHIDAGPLGDYGAPHHKTSLADSNQCTACHDPNLLCETNSAACYVPEYEICNNEPEGCTAPSPYSCENCHWPSGNIPHQTPAGTLAGNAATFLGQWTLFSSFPKPTVEPNGTPNPAPIEANGPMFSGALWPGGMNSQRPIPWAMAAKPYQPFDGTHHETGGKVYSKCYNCHGTNPDTDPSWDPTNVYLIRMCENCHDVYTIHGIAEHTTAAYGLYQSNEAIRAITADEKCVACHSDSQGQLPPLPLAMPVIWYAEPNQISPGGIVSLYHTAVTTFGAQQEGDKVQVGQDPDGVGPLPITYVDVPLYSWTEDRIQFVVPGWVFQPVPVASSIRIAKQVGVTPTGDPITANSNVVSLGIRKHPEITSLSPNSGGWANAWVSITGVGFYSFREAMGIANPAGKIYGYSTYVEFTASNDKYRATAYAAAPSWNDSTIPTKIWALYDVNYGQPVLPQNMYPGCWNVTVVTDYFEDAPAGPGSTPGKYLLATGAIDPADTLLHREVSDPICFTVTNQPQIFSVNPKIIPDANQAIVYGTFFGPTKGASYVIAGVAPKEAEILGDAIGNDDGICNPPLEACHGDGDGICEPALGELCTLNIKKGVGTRGWSNTRIRVQLPDLPPAGTGCTACPVNAYMQVIVPTANPPFSNLIPIRVVAP
ncbi:MAG: hypothetical protein ABIB41_08440 [Nitrospirota bacterium]